MTRRVPETTARPRERKLTGRAVLVMLVAFFGVVTLVNVVMIGAAISTFGGVDTPSSYQAGLAFTADEAEAALQTARDWTVTAEITAAGSDTKILTIDVHDGGGHPVANAEVTARLAHPVDAHRDVPVAMTEIDAGLYSGAAIADDGQWRLDIDVAKGGERLFRSRNRLLLR